MLIVFLDSNILFSASYRSPNLFERLWTLRDARMITSRYCAEEARRNLALPEQAQRLVQHLAVTGIVDDCPEDQLPDTWMLPAKDIPVLAAAAQARADVLLTGDRNHFGRYYGLQVMGVAIESPELFRARFSEHFTR